MTPQVWEMRRVLVTVRTYPTPAERGVEVSCTAGVTSDGSWIRLFPVPARSLDPDKHFSKYQWIDVSVKKASDPRPESYNVDLDSIKTVGRPIPTTNNWALRRPHVMPLVKHCMCCLKREREDSGSPTLGLFRPRKILQLVIERDRSDWTEKELAKLRQSTFLASAPAKELERIPFKFSYRYECDHDDCPGHKMMCSDWELGEAYRKWRSKYGDEWQGKLRQRWESEVISPKDTHFYVGTVHGHPREWIIVGLWSPRATKSGQRAPLQQTLSI
jgi:hypothetical protein